MVPARGRRPHHFLGQHYTGTVLGIEAFGNGYAVLAQDESDNRRILFRSKCCWLVVRHVLHGVLKERSGSFVCTDGIIRAHQWWSFAAFKCIAVAASAVRGK